jgi:tetratricopeptide (TPR) repeat protein
MPRWCVTVMAASLLATSCGGPEKALTPEEQLKADVRGILEQVTPKGWLDLDEQGTRLRAEKKYDEAIALYEKAVVAYPDWVEAHRQLAITLDESAGLGGTLDAPTKRARQEAAVRRYEQVLSRDATSSTAHNRVIGLYLYDLDRPADAERAARAWVAASPTSSDGWDALTDVLVRAGRPDEATRILLEAESKVQGSLNQEFVARAMLRVAAEAATSAADRLRLADGAVRLADAGLKDVPGDTALTRVKLAAIDVRAAAGKPAAASPRVPSRRSR